MSGVLISSFENQVPSSRVAVYSPQADPSVNILNSSWIWLAEEREMSDQYVRFRRFFYVDDLGDDAKLTISVDSDFVAYLNGQEVGRGQFSDFAKHKTWCNFSVGDAIAVGKNVLAVLVYYRGENFLDYQAGAAGLIALLSSSRYSIPSDEMWKASLHTAFRSGFAERMTSQCGFTFEFDCRREEAWREIAYNDDMWGAVKVVQRNGVGSVWTELKERALPCLTVGELVSVRIVGQGSYIQTEKSHVAAKSMAAAALRAYSLPGPIFGNAGLIALSEYSGPREEPGRYLSPQCKEPLKVKAPFGNMDGMYFILDLKSETVGLLDFDLEAGAGTVIEIGHGEHLEDGRVRTSIGNRNFADRYICAEGRQKFQMPFRRLGARYLQIHCNRSVIFHHFSLREVRYPSDLKGVFITHDPLAQHLHNLSLRTIDLCRHEHYEDCPWREQALYGYDGRLQALYGYYAFGDYLFPEISFSLLGDTQDTHGFLQLTAPGGWGTTIPIFTFAWIAAVSEHWLYSGKSSLFAKFRKTIELVIGRAFSKFDVETELYFPPNDVDLWHFYEWTPGLSGLESESCIGAHCAIYNLYLLEAVRSYVWMLEQINEVETANCFRARIRSLKDAIHSIFWDTNELIYKSFYHLGKRSGSHEITQVLALSEQVVPSAQQAALFNSLMSGKVIPCMLSAFYYRIQALMRHSAKARGWLDEKLGDTWHDMIFSGASTMWETAHGSRDFDCAGSLCHGWSALPIYYHQAIVLGVTPILPGFRAFAVCIYPSRFFCAKGTVPTPYGILDVSWRKRDDELIIEMYGPLECTPYIGEYEEALIFSVTYNGKHVSSTLGSVTLSTRV